MKTGTRQPALAKRPLVPPLNMPSVSIDPAQHSSKCGFPGGSVAKSLPAKQEMQVPALGREDLLEKAWQPAPAFLPGKPHAQRSLVGYSPRGLKEMDTAEPLSLRARMLPEHRHPQLSQPRETRTRPRLKVSPATTSRIRV